MNKISGKTRGKMRVCFFIKVPPRGVVPGGGRVRVPPRARVPGAAAGGRPRGGQGGAGGPGEVGGGAAGWADDRLDLNFKTWSWEMKVIGNRGF